MSNKNGIHVDFHDVYSGRGVGESSGVVYIADQTDAFSLKIGKGETGTQPIRFAMVSKGGSDNLEVRALFHVTLNANGIVTSSVDHFTVSCKE